MNTDSGQFDNEPIFMNASDVKKRFVNPDRGVGQFTQKSSYKAKLQEAKDSGLHSSIKTEGIKNPIVLQQPGTQRFSMFTRPQIFDGTHRLISALDVNPNAKVPVVFSSNKKKGK